MLEYFFISNVLCNFLILIAIHVLWCIRYFKDTNFEANYNMLNDRPQQGGGVFDISKKVKGEFRKQIYLHYAESPPFLCKDTNFEVNNNH